MSFVTTEPDVSPIHLSQGPKLLTGSIYPERKRNATWDLIQCTQRRYEEGTLLSPFYG